MSRSRSPGPRFSADCVIFLDSGMALQATGHAQDPLAAFDAAAERIEKRLQPLQAQAQLL